MLLDRSKYNIIILLPAKDKHLYPKSDHNELLDKPKLRNILQNESPAIFKSIHIVKVKEKQKYISDLKTKS